MAGRLGPAGGEGQVVGAVFFLISFKVLYPSSWISLLHPLLLYRGLGKKRNKKDNHRQTDADFDCFPAIGVCVQERKGGRAGPPALSWVGEVHDEKNEWRMRMRMGMRIHGVRHFIVRWLPVGGFFMGMTLNAVTVSRKKNVGWVRW